MSESIYINIDDLKVTKPSQSGQPTKIDIKPGAKVYKEGGSGKKSFVEIGTASATGIQDAQSRMIQQGLQEQARQQELVKQEQAKAQAEKIRIEQLNQKLLGEGARQRQEILRNQAGQKIKTTTTELNRINKGVSTNAKIYKYENLDTGETRYTTYEKPRSGMPRRLSGGVTLQGQSSSDIIQIKNELSSNGLVPVTNSSGQVVAFRSPDTQKSYSYSEGGFNAYQKDYGQAGSIFRKQVRESQEQGMSRMGNEPEYKIKIDFGSKYKNLDKLFIGALPGGITKKDVLKAKATAEKLIKDGFPEGTIIDKLSDSNDRKSYSLYFRRVIKKDNFFDKVGEKFNPKKFINKSSVVRGYNKLFRQTEPTQKQISTINNLKIIYDKIKSGKKLDKKDIGNISNINNIEKFTFGKQLFDKKKKGQKITQEELIKAKRLYGTEFDYRKFYDEDVQNAIKFTINTSSVIPGAFIPSSIISAGYSGMLEYGKQKRLNIDKKTEIKAKELALTFGEEVAKSFVIGRLMGIGATGVNIGKAVGKTYLSATTIQKLSKLSKPVLESILAGTKIMGSTYAGSLGTRAGSGIASLQRKDYGKLLQEDDSWFRKEIREGQEQGMSVANTEKESQLQEADSWFRKEIQKATSEQAKVKSEIKKLSSEGKKSEAVKLARESNELNNSLTGYKVGLRITETLQGVLQIPGVVKQLIKQPGSIIPLTASLWEGTKADLKETWQLAKVSPNQAIAKIGTDYFTGAFVGKAFKLTGKVTGKVARRINPKWKSFASGTIKINAPKEIFVRRGNQVFLKTRVGKVQAFVSKSLGGTKRAGQFKKFQTTRGITLTKGTIGKGLPLSEQLKFGGSRGTITTAQADRLVGFLKRQKLVRKPIPGEATFSSLTKKLLQRFDDGKISSKQFKLLNQRIIKETGGKTLLERSLYADPTGKVRFTRLGKDVSKEASLRDILKGDVSFRKAKPQIIVFPDDQIAKLPKQLKDIYNKLKQNKRLTPSERNRLVEFQVSNKGISGKQWKPIGDVEYRGGIELEVSLSPGNEIRRVKKLGITEINGVPVEITQAKVVRLKSKTTTLLNKAKKGAINQNEIKSLTRALKKELNMQVKKSDIKNLSKNIRRSVERKPYLPVGRVALSRGVLRVGKSLSQVGRRTARTTSRVSSRISKPTARINRRAKITRPNVPRPPRPNVPRPPRPNVPRPPRPNVPRPPRPNVREPIARLKPEEFKQSTLPKAQQTFYVVEKVRGKYKKLYPKPLTMKDARDYATHSIDNRLSKTAFFIPLGKSRRVLKAPKQIQNYYAQNSQKFRPYRIQYGQRKQLVNGFIEKRKFFNDKPGERVVAKNLRARATVKRTITPMQRQILLKRLAMARAVRMRNLRR